MVRPDLQLMGPEVGSVRIQGWAAEIIIIGMNRMMLNIPTTANNSDTRESGRRQWLLVNRKATAATGAALVIMKTKEKVAM